MHMSEVGMGVLVLVLIAIVLVILTVALFIMIRRPGPDNPVSNFHGRSMEILNERLAKGEITVEEYDELKRKIKEKADSM